MKILGIIYTLVLHNHNSAVLGYIGLSAFATEPTLHSN